MTEPEDTTQEPDAGTEPEESPGPPTSEAVMAWNEVGEHVRMLGESVAAALRESADSEMAQKVKEDANRTAAKIKEAGDSTAQKAKPAVLSTLKFLEESLTSMIARIETTPDAEAAEAGAEDSAEEGADTEAEEG